MLQEDSADMKYSSSTKKEKKKQCNQEFLICMKLEGGYSLDHEEPREKLSGDMQNNMNAKTLFKKHPLGCMGSERQTIVCQVD